MSSATLDPPAAALPDNPFAIGERLVTYRDAAGTVVGHEYVPLTEEDFLHPQVGDRFLVRDPHFQAASYLTHALRYALAGRAGVKVVGERRIDWQLEGVLPHGPDAAVFDRYPAGPDDDATIAVKDAGVQVLAVFEVTSPETRHIDFGSKYDEFERVGIPYYVVIDVAAPNEVPAILGFRHSRGEFRMMRYDQALGYHIPKLGLSFRLDGERLVVADQDGNDIPDSVEAIRLVDEAEARADAATARADALAAELAALKARLDLTTPKD